MLRAVCSTPLSSSLLGPPGTSVLPRLSRSPFTSTLPSSSASISTTQVRPCSWLLSWAGGRQHFSVVLSSPVCLVSYHTVHCGRSKAQRGFSVPPNRCFLWLALPSVSLLPTSLEPPWALLTPSSPKPRIATQVCWPLLTFPVFCRNHESPSLWSLPTLSKQSRSHTTNQGRSAGPGSVVLLPPTEEKWPAQSSRQRMIKPAQTIRGQPYALTALLWPTLV